jgi:hypothetical protein
MLKGIQRIPVRKDVEPDPPRLFRELTRRDEEVFELSVAAQTLSLADLYGGNSAPRWTGSTHRISSADIPNSTQLNRSWHPTVKSRRIRKISRKLDAIRPPIIEW